jgi:hypothetical protein
MAGGRQKQSEEKAEKRKGNRPCNYESNQQDSTI